MRDLTTEPKKAPARTAGIDRLISLLLAITLSPWPGRSPAAAQAGPGDVVPAPEPAVSPDGRFLLDFRYAPTNWQTAICLPDDWQKTLVGKEGSLLYDYPGSFGDFATRITAGLAGQTTWLRQELVSPRVPIIRTLARSGVLELEQTAFAVAPLVPPARSGPELVLERIDAGTRQANWASPPAGSDPAFRHVAIGWGGPIQYRFRAESEGRYAVVFGLCEGWHSNAAQRVLMLQVEGKPVRTVDLVKEKGRNVPQVFAFPARDQDGDGWVNLTVAAAEGSPDTNTILNLLWVFNEAELPALEELLAGRGDKALAYHECGVAPAKDQPPRHDLVVVRVRNTGTEEARVTPVLTVESAYGIRPDRPRNRVRVGSATTVYSSLAFDRLRQTRSRLEVELMPLSVPGGGEKAYVVAVGRGRDAADLSPDATEAEVLLGRAQRYWEEQDLPYDRMTVPDPGVQALLDSSIRNIYQAREIKKGLPAFQVGPTCYRGLWVVDGSFLLEAVTFVGRIEEARQGIRYLMSFQREDGAYMLIDGHWKETGIALWAISRHARLTGDRAWLESVWPGLEKGWAFILKMRAMAPPDAPNAGLIPDGFSDGGLADKVPEYTNVYWTMAGMRAALDAARWLGRSEQAAAWQRDYDDFCALFRRAAARGTRADSQGNRYLPIRMVFDDKIPPQKAQWAFLHAVFPGKVFAPEDPLVQGNMAMLKAVESEGLVLDTGWLKNGLWYYFGSFYAHAWLWLGQGRKAAETLYAFGNHASPLLTWREEHMPAGKGEAKVGDMPHNWASAEFIRLVRHALVLERGNELHLFEAMPPSWARPGARTTLRDVMTEFGPISLQLSVAAQGDSAHLRVATPHRPRPERVVLHLDNWSGRTGTVELPLQDRVEQEISLTRISAQTDPL